MKRGREPAKLHQRHAAQAQAVEIGWIELERLAGKILRELELPRLEIDHRERLVGLEILRFCLKPLAVQRRRFIQAASHVKRLRLLEQRVG